MLFYLLLLPFKFIYTQVNLCQFNAILNQSITQSISQSITILITKIYLNILTINFHYTFIIIILFYDYNINHNCIIVFLFFNNKFC